MLFFWKIFPGSAKAGACNTPQITMIPARPVHWTLRGICRLIYTLRYARRQLYADRFTESRNATNAVAVDSSSGRITQDQEKFRALWFYQFIR